jgi:phage-related protein
LVTLAIRYYRLEGQRSSPADVAIMAVPEPFRAAIRVDIELVAEHELEAPVSVKSITGHAPLTEIRTGGYRIFFVVDQGEMWVLHCCKKQDQRRAIGLAAERMKLVLQR